MSDSFFSNLIFISIMMLFTMKKVSAQENDGYKFLYSFETYLNADSDSVAFWSWANQDGKVDRKSDNFINTFTVLSPDIQVFSGLEFSFESDLIARVSKNSELYFSQIYSQLKTQNFDLKIGKFYRNQVLGQYKDLTVGSLLVSRNADPYLGYNIEAKRFLSVPFLQGYLKYKFSYGDYILGDNRFVDDVNFHSKSLYLQIDLNKYKVSAGIIHNAYWGGNSPVYGRLPSGLNSYKRIVFNNSGSGNALDGEQINRLGNSISGYDYSMSYNFENFRIQIAKLFFIEDRPASRHRSPWDGQWNATVEFSDNKLIDYVVYDHVNTKRQDAKFFEPRGRANYYAHYIYSSGFTNKNFVLGNPLISYSEIEKDFFQSTNNVLVAHHIGIKGAFTDQIGFSQRVTYSRNYGNCFDQLVESGSCNFEPDDDVELKPLSELRKDSFNLSSQLIYFFSDLKRSEISIALNFDFGDFENNFGFVFGFKTSLINQIEN